MGGDGAHGPPVAFFLELVEKQFPSRFGKGLGIAVRREIRPFTKDDGRGYYWSKECAPAGLIHASYYAQPTVPQALLESEGILRALR